MKRLLLVIIVVVLVGQALRHVRGSRDVVGTRTLVVGPSGHQRQIKLHKIKPRVGPGRVLVMAGSDAPTACAEPADDSTCKAVSGTVTFNGKPLEAGEIQFQPDSTSAAAPGSAAIQNGTYAIEGPVRPEPPQPPRSSSTPALIAEAEENGNPDAAPAWFQHDIVDGKNLSKLVGKDLSQLQGLMTIKGAQSATERRADASARTELERVVGEWLWSDVPRTWKAPSQIIDSMILDRHNEPVVHDYGELYVTGYRVDFSPARRAQIVETYQHEIVMHRLVGLGGGLGFILVCLAAVSGYIRADEATKGYYTNKLRLAAAAAVGAAGMALYRALV